MTSQKKEPFQSLDGKMMFEELWSTMSSDKEECQCSGGWVWDEICEARLEVKEMEV